MTTPFMARLNELTASPTLEMPLIATPSKADAPLMGGMNSVYDEAEIQAKAERKQLQGKYEGAQEGIQKFVIQQQQAVAQGLISPQQAELNVQNFVDGVIEKEFPGYNDERIGRDAAKYSAENPNVSGEEALKMYKQGIDPNRGQAPVGRVSEGVLMGDGQTPVMGEGKQPMLGGK